MFSFLQKKEESGETSPNRRRLWLILAAAAVGIALLLLGGGSETAADTDEKKLYSPEEDEIVLYQQYLEERIRALCESVSGVGHVTVIVTLEGGFESVYATEWIDGNEEYVILGSGSNAEALFLSRNAPGISGVGIVCSGGENLAVRGELISLISSAFHISTNRIYITAAKG